MKTGDVAKSLMKELCEVCVKNKATFVYGYSRSNFPKDNVALCAECRDLWHDMRFLYRPDSKLEDILNDILYEKTGLAPVFNK